MTTQIYLDNAATTSLLPAAGEAMQECFYSCYANPSALHDAGIAADKRVQNAREEMAELFSCRSSEVVFTSGGSEADNLALFGVAGKTTRRKLVISAIEHPAVMEAGRRLQQQGYELAVVPVDKDGMVLENELLKQVDAETVLVSIIHANNEIGTVNPVARLARKVKRAAPHVYFHTDAVQSFAHVNVNFSGREIDLLSISAHKFHGPKGVGALIVRNRTPLVPLLHGGSQEQGLRAGTTNVPGIVGMAVAAQESARKRTESRARLDGLMGAFRAHLEQELSDIIFNGHPQHRLPGFCSLSVPGVKSQNFMLFLDAEGVMVSSGAACKSTSTRTSSVLKAIGAPPGTGTIRVSASRMTTSTELERAARAVVRVVKKLRR